MRKRIYSLLSFPIFTVLYLYTAIMVIIGLPFAYLRIQVLVRFIVRFWAKGIFWILVRKLRVQGLDYIDRGRHYMILANHASLFDITAIMAIHPEVAWFGRERLMKVPVFNQILRMLNYIPMKEGNISQTRKMLDDIVAKLNHHTIALFPEGTRTLDGNMSEFYKGFAYILKSTNADVLPITLNGFYTLKPKNRFHINFNARLSVIIGKPIKSATLREMTNSEIITEVRKIIEAEYIQPNPV